MKHKSFSATLLQWNLNRNSYIFIKENGFENVVWKMVAILSGPQCVKYHTIKCCPYLSWYPLVKEPLGANFSEILVKIQSFFPEKTFKNTVCKLSSILFRPHVIKCLFCFFQIKPQMPHWLQKTGASTWKYVTLLMRQMKGEQFIFRHEGNDSMTPECLVSIQVSWDHLLYVHCRWIHQLIFMIIWCSLNSFRPSDAYMSVIQAIFASDNGLSPVRPQAIIWTNAIILSIIP